MPVTRPAFVTVAMPVLLLPQAPPVVGVTVAVKPTQTLVAPPKVGFDGMALMTILADDGDTQVLALVTVKV